MATQPGEHGASPEEDARAASSVMPGGPGLDLVMPGGPGLDLVMSARPGVAPRTTTVVPQSDPEAER